MSKNSDWVSGKLALPPLASAFVYVDLRELWDYNVRKAPLGFIPSWGLWSKEQKTGFVCHWFSFFPNSFWSG